MRVLILTQWYPPEPALLIQELAQTLQTLGNDVTVLTGFPNYPAGQLYPGYRLQLYQRETIEAIPIVRVPLYPEHSRSGLGRFLNYISFALSSSVLGAWLVSRPDIIFVYHPPLTVGLPATILSKLWRVPFIYQVQDMWPETLRATGMLNNETILKWIAQFAQWLYSQATAICVISPGFYRNLVMKGVPPEKIHVVSNWVDTNVYYPAQPDTSKAQELGMMERFNIIFAGNIGEAQGLHTLIEAAVLLQDLPMVQFVIIGDGIALPSLRDAVEEHGLSNIKFLGRYPTSAMPKLYALADVLLVHLSDDPLFRITIPHKTFAYMASGKPILAAVTGDVADIIINAGVGIACPPENPEAMAHSIRQLYRMSKEDRQKMGQNGLRAANTTYSRHTLIAQIDTILQHIVLEQEEQTLA